MATYINADTLIGSAVVGGDASGIIQLQGGGTPRITFNTSGALGIGSTPSYGTAGQVLVSNGTSAEASWGAVVTNGKLYFMGQF